MIVTDSQLAPRQQLQGLGFWNFLVMGIGAVVSAVSGANATPVQAPPPPPPPPPWYKTNKGYAVIGVGAVATLGLGYYLLSSPPPRAAPAPAAPLKGYSKRRRNRRKGRR